MQKKWRACAGSSSHFSCSFAAEHRGAGGCPPPGPASMPRLARLVLPVLGLIGDEVRAHGSYMPVEAPTPMPTPQGKVHRLLEDMLLEDKDATVDDEAHRGRHEARSSLVERRKRLASSLAKSTMMDSSLIFKPPPTPAPTPFPALLPSRHLKGCFR